MKVTHIGTADTLGGAAQASFALHCGLLARGIDSRMVVNQMRENRPEISRVGWSRDWLPARIAERAVLELETLTGFQYQIQPWRRQIPNHPFVKDADVIHLHNLHGNFFATELLAELSTIAPLVWSLYDTWALTGHCSYNYDCDRWKIGCGQCPNLEEYPPIKIDRTAALWRNKKRLYAIAQPTFIAPSKWMFEMIRSSRLMTDRCATRQIPHGIDTDFWQSIGRGKAREILGIPNDRFVVMAIGGIRKGVDVLVRALSRLIGIDVLSAGSEGVPGATYPQGECSLEHLRICYSAADVFVMPSLAETMGLMVMQAMSCGLPVIGSDVGGIPDLIEHARTGFLVEPGDSEELRHRLGRMPFYRETIARMGERGRARIVDHFSIGWHVEQHIQLYESVLRRPRGYPDPLVLQTASGG